MMIVNARNSITVYVIMRHIFIQYQLPRQQYDRVDRVDNVSTNYKKRQQIVTRKPCCRRESARCRCNFRSI